MKVRLRKLEITIVLFTELCQRVDFIDDNFTDPWSYGDADRTLISPSRFRDRAAELYGRDSVEAKALDQALIGVDYIDLEN
jgi:hypothetical protein